MKIAVTGLRGIPNILGGVETHCEELFTRLSEKGYDISLFRRKSYTNDNLKEYKGVKLYDLRAPRKKSLEAVIHTLKAVLYARFALHADVIHIHAIGPGLLTGFARFLGLKTVVTHHGPDYERAKWGKLARFMLRLGERTAVKNADEVIVISNIINDIIKTKYKRYDAHLIYNGVARCEENLDRNILNEWDLTPKTYILTMGRFVPEKNFHQLINAFSSIDQDKYRLVIAGDADIEDNYSRNLKKLAKEKNVILTGLVKGARLQALLNYAVLFVLPSSYEGLPISLLEAMSFDLPVIVSDIAANREVHLDEKSYFSVGNELQLAEKINEFISNPVDRVVYNMEQYSWDAIAALTGEVYAKLNQ